jgi:hypothetical protein
MKKLVLLIMVSVLYHFSFAQANQTPIPVLIRCDDLGMSRAVNDAARKVLEAGYPVSMSVMVPCGWFSDAVELLKQYPNVSVGIHLTLNAEWKQYRWGPVAGSSKVPTLVDSLGHFFPSRSALFANNPGLADIETELRAQIEKALKAGLKIDYLDYHMGAAMQTPETRAVVEKLAKEYRVAISRYYGEADVPGVYAAPIASKKDTLLLRMKELQPGAIRLFVHHVGINTPELAAMEDMNTFGLKQMGAHREAEMNALTSPEFLQMIRDKRYRMVNYGMLNREIGLDNMKRPAGW